MKSDLINKNNLIILSVLVGLTILGIGTYSILNSNSVFPVTDDDSLSIKKIYFANYTEQIDIGFYFGYTDPLSMIISLETNDALYINFNSYLDCYGNYGMGNDPVINVKLALYLNDTQLSHNMVMWFELPINDGQIYFRYPLSLQWFDTNISPGIYNLSIWASNQGANTNCDFYSSSLFAQVYSIN